MSQRSFHVIHKRAARGRQYYSDMPPAGKGFDFHEAYPTSAQVYLDQFCEPLADDISGDRVMALPKQSRDQVFAHLSIMDLDAARCTCKAWWNWITTNVWLLRSVLLPIDTPWTLRQSQYDRSLKEASELRRLNIEFHCAAKALHHLHEDRSWKQTFRAVDLEFGFSSSHISETQTIEWISYWNPVRVVILLVKVTLGLRENSTVPKEEKRVIFYSLDSCCRPIHLGTVNCPKYVCQLEVVGLGHDVLSRSFHHPILLRSSCHTWLRFCTVEPRAHFANNESFLKLVVVPMDYGPLNWATNSGLGMKRTSITNTEQYVARLEAIRACDIMQRKNESGISLTLAAAKQDEPRTRVIEDRETGRWVLLGEMEFTEYLSTDCPCLCSQRLIVAKHITSEELHLVIVRHVKEADANSERGSYTVKSRIHISSPREGIVFRNLSVCYGGNEWCPRKFRMIISWMDPLSLSCLAELYLYKIKLDESRRHIKGKALRQIRISTIPSALGGLHQESPLRHLQQSMWSSTNSTDGGLALNPKTKFDRGIEDNAGQSGPGRNAAVYVQNGVQIVVFGVSKENGKACMRFLDLSPHFDDPWGSALTDAIVPNGSKAIISDHTSTRTYKRLICTCPMHDLAYSVSLPEDASGICEVLEEKSLQSVDDFRLALPKGFEGRHRANERGWHDPYWNEAHAKLKFSQLGQHFKATLNGPGLLNRVSTSIHDVSSQSVDKGTVIQYVSAHRAAGLERLKKRGQLFIQIMRDDGIADEDIANWWSNAMWCWWNLLAKPDGWRRAAWQGVSRAFVPK